LFRLFHLFQTYVVSASFGCCIYMHVLSVFSCFKHIFQVFYLDVAYILQWLHMCFSSVSDVCCKCLIWMLQKYIWFCTCCNGTHLSSCMCLGRGGGWRQGHGRSPPVHAAGRGRRLSPSFASGTK
jgi:hypothetical protein